MKDLKTAKTWDVFWSVALITFVILRIVVEIIIHTDASAVDNEVIKWLTRPIIGIWCDIWIVGSLVASTIIDCIEDLNNNMKN